MKYNIPCSWEMYGTMEIIADSLKDAIYKANNRGIPDGEYVSGSFLIDDDCITIEEE